MSASNSTQGGMMDKQAILSIYYSSKNENGFQKDLRINNKYANWKDILVVSYSDDRDNIPFLLIVATSWM